MLINALSTSFLRTLSSALIFVDGPAWIIALGIVHEDLVRREWRWEWRRERRDSKAAFLVPRIAFGEIGA